MRDTTIEKRNVQRSTVLDAAAKMFAERGFSGASLGDVAKDLGISRSTLYYYFPSKEAILSSLIDEITVKSMKSVEEIMRREAGPAAKLHEMTFNHILFVLRHKLSFMVVIKTEEELIGEARRRNLEAKKAVLEGFSTVVRHGIENGDFRRMDASTAALGIIGMCNWSAFWYNPEGRLSDVEVAQELTCIALGAVLNVRGGEQIYQEIGGVLTELQGVTTRLVNLQKKY